MIVRFLRSIAMEALEMLVVIFLVLAFFFIFLSQLEAFFPSSAGLNDLMKRQNLFGGGRLDSVQGSTITLEGDFDVDDLGSLTAVLSSARNTVKSKRGNAVAWTNARKGMVLHEQDAVQTLDDSSARIVFDNQNYINMGQNSLVVIRRFERDLFRNENRSLLLMVEGELSGRLEKSGEEAVMLQVATPSAVTRIHSGSDDQGAADFKITINEDQSSTIAVFSGTAEIITGEESVLLEENHSLVIAPDGSRSALRTLPDPPLLSQPATESVFYYRELPPKITFTWKPTSAASGFRLLLARDAAFSDVIAEQLVEEPRFVHGNLREGTYYWRVSSIDRDSEGQLSRSSRLRVVEDSQAPDLRVNFPFTISATERYRISGHTESGSQVFVDGQPVEVMENGQFSHVLALNRGSNVIVVEAIDAAGNVAYESQIVNGKF